MSIYEDNCKERPVSAVPVPEKEPLLERPPVKARGCGCGCGSCLLGCFGSLLLCLVVGSVSAWLAVHRLPDWTRDAIVAAIDESPLEAAEKQRVVAQVERVYSGYKEGDLTLEHVGAIAERVTNSPVFGLTMTYAVEQKYVAPSGLDEREKEAARVQLQRLVRGVFENQVETQELEQLFDYISTTDASGQRHIHQQVSDQELRAMLAKCRRISDEAQVPAGRFAFDIGREVELMVDEVLAP